MTRDELVKELIPLFEEQNKTWQKIVEAINGYVDTNSKDNLGYVSVLGYTELDSKVDGLALKTAWIRDRLNGKLPTDRDSFTKKVRKVLGYTYP